MDIEEWIAFAVSALIMVWAFRSAAFAFSGGQGSGLHEEAPPSEEQSMPTAADLETSYQRRHRFHQAVLFLAGLGVTGAIVAMLIGSLLA